VPSQRYYEWQWKVLKGLLILAACGAVVLYVVRNPGFWVPMPENFGQ